MAEKTKEIELAWAAGFFDGEGNCSYFDVPSKYSEKSYARITLQIAQTDRRVLDRFGLAVGYPGRVNGPYKHNNPNAKDYFTYTLANLMVVHTIEQLLPYVSEVKRLQMEKALQKFLTHEKLARGPSPKLVGSLNEIRYLFQLGYTNIRISKQFSVSAETIRLIRNGTLAYAK